MIDRSIIFVVGASLLAFLAVLELVRRRLLSEAYSLLWLGTAAAMIVVAIWRDLLHNLAALVGIAYPPALLFLLAALFLLAIQLYFSIVITKLTRESKEAAQAIALLRQDLRELRDAQDNGEGDEPGERGGIDDEIGQARA